MDDALSSKSCYGRAVARFRGTLFKYPGKGGWTFVAVPDDCAPPVTEGWGRTPVRATLNGVSWDTSVWRDTKTNRTLLPIPKKIHKGALGDGDEVVVDIGPR